MARHTCGRRTARSRAYILQQTKRLSRTSRARMAAIKMVMLGLPGKSLGNREGESMCRRLRKHLASILLWNERRLYFARDEEANWFGLLQRGDFRRYRRVRGTNSDRAEQSAGGTGLFERPGDGADAGAAGFHLVWDIRRCGAA